MFGALLLVMQGFLFFMEAIVQIHIKIGGFNLLINNSFIVD